MSEVKQKWPSTAFDAVRVTVIDGDLKIEGTDGDEVELEGEYRSRHGYEFNPQPVGRWLALDMWVRHGKSELTLRLPRSKAWVVDVGAPRADVEVSRIRARLRIMLGQGDVRVEDCQGHFALAAGKGDVELARCTEVEVPERPPFPEGQPEPAGAATGGMPNFPPMPRMPEGPEFMFGFRHGPKFRWGRGPHSDEAWDWEDWNGEEWAQWGSQVGEQASAWAQGFVAQLFSRFNWPEDKPGINLQAGHGDASLKEIQCQACVLGFGSGDLELERGRIQKLDLQTGNGDLNIKDVLPTGEWTIYVRHGDVHLDLPNETQGRLDVATRHGDIDSEIPLVRVNRPGRESRHGGRMVGSVGSGEGQGAQISVTTLSGDIQIRGPKGSGVRAERPVESYAPPPTAPAATPQSEDRPSGVATATTPQSEDRPTSAAPGYDSQLAVLQALAEGKLSVRDAEALLKSLNR